MSMVSYEKGKVPPPPTRTETQISAFSENKIDTSDIPPITEEQWKQRRPNPYYVPTKTPMTLEIDTDVLAWLQRTDENYQFRLNSILREAMLQESNF